MQVKLLSLSGASSAAHMAVPNPTIFGEHARTLRLPSASGWTSLKPTSGHNKCTHTCGAKNIAIERRGCQACWVVLCLTRGGTVLNLQIFLTLVMD